MNPDRYEPEEPRNKAAEAHEDYLDAEAFTRDEGGERLDEAEFTAGWYQAERSQRWR